MQFVQRHHRADQSIRFRPVVNVRRQLFRLAPQYANAGATNSRPFVTIIIARRCSSSVVPFAVAVRHKVGDYNLYFVRFQVPLNGRIAPQGTIVHEHALDFEIRMIPQDQFSPQRQLLFARGQDGLNGEKGRKVVKFGKGVAVAIAIVTATAASSSFGSRGHIGKHAQIRSDMFLSCVRYFSVVHSQLATRNVKIANAQKFESLDSGLESAGLKMCTSQQMDPIAGLSVYCKTPTQPTRNHHYFIIIHAVLNEYF